MRQCPTLEGELSPLIAHRIGIAVCFQRQSSHYHKCHRCVYRGKPADFEATTRTRLTPQVSAAQRNGPIEIPQAPAPATPAEETSGETKTGKRPAKKTKSKRAQRVKAAE